MPNHVINKLTFTCGEERLRQILSEICYDQQNDGEYGPGTFDFNKIKPMPESLNIECGSSTTEGIDLYLTAVNPSGADLGLKKLSEEEFRGLLEAYRGDSQYRRWNANLTPDKISNYTAHRNLQKLLTLGETAVNNQIRYGAPTWYEWRWNENNWNTKWNSYDSEPYDGGDSITFQTAWSAPHPVIQGLSEKYPEVSILHQWADEDIGRNCGWAEYEHGEEVQSCVFDGGPEAEQFAEDLWAWEPDEDYDMDPDEPGLLL